MKKLSFGILLILFFSTAGKSQTLKAWLRAADESFAGKDYYSALKYYEIATDIDEEDIGILYKYGEAARLFNAYTLADSIYERIIESGKGGEFPLILFHLAETKKKLGKYQAAADLFSQFATGSSDKNYRPRALSEAQYCRWAADKVQHPNEKIEISKMGDEVNTPASEFGAIESDGFLYFSSFNFEDEHVKTEPKPAVTKILRIEKGEPAWEIVNFEEENVSTKTATFPAHTAFAENGKAFYYTMCDYQGDAEIECQIFVRRKGDDGAWGRAHKLPDAINKVGYLATQPTVGLDKATGNEVLYFVSDRPKGHGGKDIWYSVISKEGDYSKPKNLKAINTEGDDITPFFHEKSQTLFFSSDRRKGLGGFDIYKSHKVDTTWSKPVHLDFPLNSSYNDIYYTINPGQSKGYLSSNRLGSAFIDPEKEACCYDVYSFITLDYNLKLFSFESTDGQPLSGVTVRLFEITADGEKEIDTHTNENGNDFSFELLKGKKYKFIGSKNGYVDISEELDLGDSKLWDSKDIIRNLFFNPVDIDLTALTFDAETKKPLEGATVQLFIDYDQVGIQENLTGNEFKFQLEVNLKYTVIAFKAGFHSDTVTVDLKALKNPEHVKKQLFLRVKDLTEFPPLVLYFDNDEPDKKSWKRTTKKVYEETYNAYYARKNEFKTEYSSVLEGRDKFLAEQRIEAFFEREVKNGYQSLVVFMKRLLFMLQRGNKIEVFVKGYASPRGERRYNFKLGKRRVSCLTNNFFRFEGGALLPYIKSGQLILKEKSFGEDEAPAILRERLKDDRNSIYSVLASLERKVVIVGVRIDK